MLKSNGVLQNIFLWFGFAILIISPFLPRTSLAKQYIPDFCKRRIVTLVGAFLASILISVTVMFSNIRDGVCLLGIIAPAIIIAVAHHLFMCSRRKKV